MSDELENFSASSMRGPKSSVYNQLLSQTLIKASRTRNALDKIQYICEAAQLCRKQDGINMALVDICLNVSISLKNSDVKPNMANAIPWAFTMSEENHEKYIKPWNEIRPRYYPWETTLRYNEYPTSRSYGTSSYSEQKRFDEWQTKVIKEISDRLKQMKPHERFEQLSGAISLVGFSSLKGEFEQWALSQLMPIQSVILDHVDPATYRDTMKLLLGGREDGDEVDPR